MAEPTYQTITGGFPLGQHLEMVMDEARIEAIKCAIDYNAEPNKSFLELGVGTGIFLEHARYRYREAIGVDADPAILEVADRTLASPGPPNWKLILGDARTVELAKSYDVLLCEMLSTWCIIEPQVEVVCAAKKRLLSPRATIIPRRVVNLIELGSFSFGRGPVHLPTPYLQLAGVRNPIIMSTSQVAFTIDFTNETGPPLVVDGLVRFQPLVSGIANCVRICSLIELAPGITWFSSDTLMPMMVFPLENELQVERNKPVVVSFRCRHGSRLDQTKFSIGKE